MRWNKNFSLQRHRRVCCCLYFLEQRKHSLFTVQLKSRRIRVVKCTLVKAHSSAYFFSSPNFPKLLRATKEVTQEQKEKKKEPKKMKLTDERSCDNRLWIASASRVQWIRPVPNFPPIFFFKNFVNAKFFLLML